MMTMGYNGYVAGCSGDGVSEPVPMRRKHTMGAIAPFFCVTMETNPDIHVRGMRIY